MPDARLCARLMNVEASHRFIAHRNNVDAICAVTKHDGKVITVTHPYLGHVSGKSDYCANIRIWGSLGSEFHLAGTRAA